VRRGAGELAGRKWEEGGRGADGKQEMAQTRAQAVGV